MTMVMMTSIALTRETERGTMETLLAMPSTPVEVMLSKILPYFAVGAGQVAVVLLAARGLFAVPFVGRLSVLLAAVFVFVLALVLLGYAISTLARTQMQAMQLTFFFFLPSILLSGFMFPYRGMPEWAQLLGQLFPLTHFIRAIRAVMLKGGDLGTIARELTAPRDLRRRLRRGGARPLPADPRLAPLSDRECSCRMQGMSETALRTASPAAPPGRARDGGPAALDAFLDPEVRRAIEETWTARINERATLAAALADPSFLRAPSRHVALYADHGVVHARDVALMLLQVLDTANGRLIPARAPDRLGWMKAYGVLLASLHDIGMADCSAAGRAMHPEFATQVVLGPEFDGILRRLRDDARGIATRIFELGRAGALGGQAPEAVLREALALANCHSKSKVPTALLNDPGALRRAMLAAAAAEVPARAGRPRPRHADFAWLELAAEPGRALVEDVIDTLRALRCADALRQRGTGAEDLGQLRNLRRRTLGQRRLRPASGSGAPLLPRGAGADRRRRGEPRQQPARRRRRPAHLLPPRRLPRRGDRAQGGAERGARRSGHPGRRDRQLRAATAPTRIPACGARRTSAS